MSEKEEFESVESILSSLPEDEYAEVHKVLYGKGT